MLKPIRINYRASTWIPNARNRLKNTPGSGADSAPGPGPGWSSTSGLAADGLVSPTAGLDYELDKQTLAGRSGIWRYLWGCFHAARSAVVLLHWLYPASPLQTIQPKPERLDK